MSKKKLAVVILLIIFAVVSNCLLLQYKEDTSGKSISMELCVKVQEEDELQIYYLDTDYQGDGGFNESESETVRLSGSEEIQKFTFTVPAGIDRLRFDIGKKSGNSVEIAGAEIAYKNQTKNIDTAKLSSLIDSKDVISEGMTHKAGSDDSYIVWDCRDWGLTDLTDAYAESASYKGIKIAGCVLIDVFVLFFIVHAYLLAEFPLEMYVNRKLIARLSVNDFKTRYAASFFGVVWAFIQPLVTVMVYWFVFEKGLKAGGQTLGTISVPFILFLISGIVPWFFFQDALNGVTNALTGYTYLVKKVVFNIEVLPVIKVVSAMFVHVFFIAITLLIFTAYGYAPDIYNLQLLYYSFALALFVTGIGYITCSVVVFFRDLSEMINIILSIGVWITPIMWNLETTIKSPVLKAVFMANPLYYIVSGYRDSLINRVGFWRHPALGIYFWSLTIILFFAGRKLFAKLRVHFADVL